MNGTLKTCNACVHMKRTRLMDFGLCERTRVNAGPPDPVDGTQATRVISCHRERRPISWLARLFGNDRCGVEGRHFEASKAATAPAPTPPRQGGSGRKRETITAAGTTHIIPTDEPVRRRDPDPDPLVDLASTVIVAEALGSMFDSSPDTGSSGDSFSGGGGDFGGGGSDSGSSSSSGDW